VVALAELGRRGHSGRDSGQSDKDDGELHDEMRLV
jgi:hypothetical protein